MLTSPFLPACAAQENSLEISEEFGGNESLEEVIRYNYLQQVCEAFKAPILSVQHIASTVWNYIKSMWAIETPVLTTPSEWGSEKGSIGNPPKSHVQEAQKYYVAVAIVGAAVYLLANLVQSQPGYFRFLPDQAQEFSKTLILAFVDHVATRPLHKTI